MWRNLADTINICRHEYRKENTPLHLLSHWNEWMNLKNARQDAFYDVKLNFFFSCNAFQWRHYYLTHTKIASSNKGAPIGSKKWWCATGLGRNLQPLGWIWEPQEHSMGDWFLCLTGENHCPEFWVRFNLPQKLHTYIRNQFWSRNKGNLHQTFRVWQKKCTTGIP